MRKVIIIDNNRVGLFDLVRMEAENISKAQKENTYKLNIQYDDVLKSKTLVRKIKKIIERRKKYDSFTNKAKMVRYDKKWREKGRI